MPSQVFGFLYGIRIILAANGSNVLSPVSSYKYQTDPGEKSRSANPHNHNNRQNCLS